MVVVLLTNVKLLTLTLAAIRQLRTVFAKQVTSGILVDVLKV